MAEKDVGTKRRKTQEKNVSAYIRKCIFEQSNNPAAIQKELKGLAYQVRKIGVNINQVAAKVNAGYATPVDMENLLFYLKKVEEEFLRLEKNLKEQKSWPSQK
ncbi:hypothetical protein BN3660_02266 [Eubacteriaceae bacterium CHKCI004]|uniref:plasmid mobilization relaxosome protein MobC n=1 Tax=Eubacterium sp. An11 TaxID=1965542 RepID=UPI0007A7D8A3|nr:plasmid mobilization relaxosome protein MobC [Eubacterium sp. An11]CVI71522.1 hypothetical protein BN3660_02266 [Eubacteriaceae bacterium CHKCI004]